MWVLTEISTKCSPYWATRGPEMDCSPQKSVFVRRDGYIILHFSLIQQTFIEFSLEPGAEQGAGDIKMNQAGSLPSGCFQFRGRNPR